MAETLNDEDKLKIANELQDRLKRQNLFKFLAATQQAIFIDRMVFFHQQKIIKKIIKIERFLRKRLIGIKALKNSLIQDMIDQEANLIRENEKALMEAQETSENKIAHIDYQINNMRQALNYIGEQKSALTKQIENQETSLQNLKTKMSQAKNELNIVSKNLEEAHTVKSKIHDDLKIKNKTKKDAEEDLSKIQNHLKEKEEMLSKMESDIHAHEATIAAKEKALQDFQEQHAQGAIEISADNYEKSFVDHEANQMFSQMHVYLVYQEIEDSNIESHISNLKKDESEKQSHLNAILTDIKKLEKDLNHCEHKIMQLEHRKAQIEHILRNLKIDHTTQSTKLNQLKGEYQLLEMQERMIVDRMKQLEVVKSYREQERDFQMRITDIEKDAPNIQQRISKLDQDLTNSNKAIQSLTLAISKQQNPEKKKNLEANLSVQKEKKARFEAQLTVEKKIAQQNTVELPKLKASLNALQIQITPLEDQLARSTQTREIEKILEKSGGSLTTQYDTSRQGKRPRLDISPESKRIPAAPIKQARIKK